MLRSVLAVLLGWTLVGLLVISTDVALLKLFPDDYIEGKLPPDSLALFSLCTSSIWSVLGAWLCASIARARVWRHAIYLMAWGQIIGAVSAVMSWGRIQSWYLLGLLAAWPVAIVIGTWIRTSQVPAENR